MFKSTGGMYREVSQAITKYYDNLIESHGTRRAIKNIIVRRNNRVNTGNSTNMNNNYIIDLVGSTYATPAYISHLNGTPQYFIDLTDMINSTVNADIGQACLPIKFGD